MKSALDDLPGVGPARFLCWELCLNRVRAQ